LLRDRDRILGDEFTAQVWDMGIKEVLSAPRSPRQRGYVQRIPGRISRWIKTRRNRTLCSGRKPGVALPFRTLQASEDGFAHD
jgi:hypothetical protein